MHLVETDTIKAPEGARVGALTTPDGITLRYALWDAAAEPHRGTVVLCHGRTEFIEKYYETIADLRARGFSVATFDWRGQGFSDRLTGTATKGHVERFEDYDIDLEAFMRQIVLPDCRPPFFGLAHSMGGAILLRNAHAGRDWFERTVLSAPMVDLSQVRISNALRAFTRFLRLLGLGRLTVPGGSPKPYALEPFDGNLLTSDPARYEETASLVRAEPRLGLGAPTIAWMAEAMRIMQDFADPFYAREMRQPILIVAAGADGIVSTPAIDRLSERLHSGRALIIPGARHELMMERDILRAQFFAAFDAFVPGERAW